MTSELIEHICCQVNYHFTLKYVDIAVKFHLIEHIYDDIGIIGNADYFQPQNCECPMCGQYKIVCFNLLFPGC